MKKEGEVGSKRKRESSVPKKGSCLGRDDQYQSGALPQMPGDVDAWTRRRENKRSSDTRKARRRRIFVYWCMVRARRSSGRRSRIGGHSGDYADRHPQSKNL